MKNKLSYILVGVLFLSQLIQSQNLEEKFNLRMGFIGGWLSYDQPLGNEFLLNGEFGYVGGIVGGNFLFTSIIEIEPRFYYNLQKRVEKIKNTKNNSANYIAMHLSYLPDIFTTAKYNSTNIERSFNVIPTYGLRRNISRKLNFDFEIGLGYQFLNGEGNGGVPNLGFGISYSL